VNCRALIPTFLVFFFPAGLWAQASGCEPTDDGVSLEDLAQVQKQIHSLQPDGYYVLIDTASNKLWLRHGNRIVFEALCSTGSGRRFECDGRSWTFETPRGEFKIRAKIPNPVWRKPDWAFLEEGEPVPEDEGKRYQDSGLGEYALPIGGAYFIHGTLYERTLGRNVTHGCIRLGAEDLLRLVEMAPIGTKVYIF
jgi:hypothetical protein